MQDVPRSTFKFDFEFERRILAEVEKENPDWSKFVGESHQRPSSSRPPAPTSSPLVFYSFLPCQQIAELPVILLGNFIQRPLASLRNFIQVPAFGLPLPSFCGSILCKSAMA